MKNNKITILATTLCLLGGGPNVALAHVAQDSNSQGVQETIGQWLDPVQSSPPQSNSGIHFSSPHPANAAPAQPSTPQSNQPSISFATSTPAAPANQSGLAKIEGYTSVQQDTTMHPEQGTCSDPNSFDWMDKSDVGQFLINSTGFSPSFVPKSFCSAGNFLGEIAGMQ